MLELLSFTADENLTRIIIDADTKYILVEGEDDVPIYDNIMISNRDVISCDYVVVHGGGKDIIKEFICTSRPSNVFAIFDRDFDYEFRIDFEKYIILEKYSIENYMFDLNVLTSCLSLALKKRVADIKESFNYDKWVGCLKDKLTKMLIILYYYQKKYDGIRDEWSSLFILDGGGHNWEPSSTIIDGFISELLRRTSINIASAIRYFKRSSINIDHIDHYFPGKMLFESFYRYSYVYAESVSKKKFKANYTNSESYKNSLSLCLRNSEALNAKLQPVFNFLLA